MVLPPGQKYVESLKAYFALGRPKVDIAVYRLEVSGERDMELSYDELKGLERVELTADLHCVEGWSVKAIKFKGPRISSLPNLAGLGSARYVRFQGLDGYASIVPLEDAMDERAILVLKMDGQPLSMDHGFPARPFIPHLYAWKSAKWLHKIQLLEEYVDGYWEARGYHERGNVWKEERVKRPSSRAR